MGKPSGDRRCAAVHGIVAALSAWVLPQAASATMADPAQICDRVAAIAAERSGVPTAVLQAISLTETGRARDMALRPWPWTVNMEGEGHWFDSADEARAYVFREFKRGARSFDVGCFQINYKWHGEAFTSIDQMFDPVANATYAAQLLRDLYSETGSWSAAAGAYHSERRNMRRATGRGSIASWRTWARMPRSCRGGRRKSPRYRTYWWRCLIPGPSRPRLASTRFHC